MSKIYAVFLFALLSSSAFMLQSCGKGGAKTDAAPGKTDVSVRVPANANVVFALNVPQLFTKSNFEKLKGSDLYKRFLDDAPAEAKEIFMNPASTGLDMQSQWVGFVQVNPSDERENFMGFIIPVADAAKWEALLKKAAEKNPNKAVEKNGYQLIDLRGGSYLAWDKKIVAIIASDAYGTSLSPANEQNIARIFKPEGDNIQTNASFKKHFGENKDMLVWVSADNIIKKMLEGPEGGQLKMMANAFGVSDAAFVGNSFAAYHDFQNGKIESAIYYDFSQELRTKFGKVFNDKQSQDYSKYLPAQDLNMAFGASLNLNELYSVLAAMRMTNRFDSQLSDLGITSQEALGALKGDGLIGLYANATTQQPDFVFVAGVNNKANVEKLMQVTTVLRLATVTGDRFEAQMGPQKVYGYIGNDVFAFSNMSSAIEKIATGGFAGEAANNPAIQTIASGWAGMAIVKYDMFKDMASIATGDYMLEGTSGSKAIDLITAEITSVVAVAQNNKATNNVIFKTTDKNALARWIELAEELYKLRAENRKARTVQ
jgi:hypothetical protein